MSPLGDGVIDQRLRRLWRRARRGGAGRRGTVLRRLEDSRRPLLFALLPRMVHGDGKAPESLQGAFAYIEQGRHAVAPVTVSSARWRRALATSRRLAARRAARGQYP